MTISPPRLPWRELLLLGRVLLLLRRELLLLGRSLLLLGFALRPASAQSLRRSSGMMLAFFCSSQRLKGNYAGTTTAYLRHVPTQGDGTLRAAARIAVVRALHGLGDMLCAVPALSALRAAHPQAQISLIGLPCCKWLLERFSEVIDALIPFPGYPGIPEQPYSPHALASFLEGVHAREFDLAIQMHGSGVVSNAFTALLGARNTAGLFEPGRCRPDNGRYFPYPHHGPEVDRWLYLTDMLDCPAGDKTTVFPISDSDRAGLIDHPLLGRLSSARYVCIHAGARDPLRRWQADRFARVGDELHARGYEVVLTGTASERETADAVANRMRADVINAAGGTSLGTIAALLERAALLVTNDTGVSHLAASLRTPSVVVFLASDPERWAPVDRTLHRPVIARELIRQPIESMRRSRAAIPEADEVLDEAFVLLEGGAA